MTTLVERGFTSRKLIFSIIVIILATAMLANAMLTPEVWGNVVTVVTIAYLTGNVADKWQKK